MTVAVQLNLPGVEVTTAPPAYFVGGRAPSPAVRRQMDRWGATEVFDAYWVFAVRRQEVLARRLAGFAPPWTDDPILARHRFTNVYRFTDRVSQDLLTRVQYRHGWGSRDLVFRTLLYKFFNRVDTWSSLCEAVGEPTIETFDVDVYGQVLGELRRSGRRIYSAAYIVPNPAHGQPHKHLNHLRLLAAMLDNGTLDALANASCLHELYETAVAVPSLGPFLAFQYSIDINYSEVTSAGEADFVVAGPGARDGLRKCFAALPSGAEAQAIRWVAETQNEHLARLGLVLERPFERMFQPIDCQNLFCEVDKYARVAFPDAIGLTGRSRIKQAFQVAGREPLEALFCPPKWLQDTAGSARASVESGAVGGQQVYQRLNHVGRVPETHQQIELVCR